MEKSTGGVSLDWYVNVQGFIWRKLDNYGAIVKIENIVGDPSKVDENSLFTLIDQISY